MREQNEDGPIGLGDFGDNIDVATFEQILEMDDDEDEREFSRSIVFDFFQQADSTFDKMDENMCVASESPSPWVA
jgi:osomolarity two-component system phosphorelay intermediate protein YPD1